VDGVVISRSIDVGQTIAATMQSPTLFSIANDLKRMQVNANVDEADIGNITDAADVKFTVDAYPNETFAGRIAEIRLSPQTVQNVVTYSVILSIENPEMKLKPGMTANITITVDQRADVLKVPNAALRYTPTGMEGGNPEMPVPPVVSTEAEEAAPLDLEEQVHVQQAPGQNWNPADKLRFSRPLRKIHRQAVAWVLNVQNQLEPRHIVLGITDGSSTEVISGELKAGDAVIIGDSTQGATGAPPQGQGGFGPFGR
jgi:HlyD family secretion protein